MKKDSLLRVRKALRSNWPLKLVALLFAAVLWAYVISSENPVRPLNVVGVRISYTGIDSLTARGLTVDKKNLQETVDVTVSAGQQYHKNITADSVRVVADLSGVSAKGMYEIKLQVSTSSFNAAVKKVSTATVQVKVDDLVQRTIPVRSILEGEPAEGYYVPEPLLSEQSIVISGPREELEQIVEAVCRIPVEGISEGSKTSRVLELLNGAGEAVPSSVVNGAVPSVIVELHVLSKKTVPVDAEASRACITNVREGYEVTGVSPIPSEVEIVGSAEELLAIESVKFKPVSVENASQSFLMEDIELQVPEGVQVLGGARIDAYLQIGEKQGQQHFTGIEISPVNLAPGLKATLKTRSADVTVSGGLSAVRNLTRKNVVLYVDLAGLAEGTYVLPVRAEEIAGVDASGVKVGVASITVTISRR